MSQSTVGKGIDEFLECAGWERLISEVVAEGKARPSFGGRIAGSPSPLLNIYLCYTCITKPRAKE